MQLTISKEGRRIVDIVLRDKARLPRKSSGVMTLPLAIRFDGPLGAIGGLFRILERIAEHHPVGLRDSPGGLGQKKIEIPEMPLDQMARQFGFDPAELLKNM
ncbi:MAG: hypothetical protein ACLR8Y_13920 [Alistipes indistinctus]